MEDNIFTLKADIKQCIANDIKELVSNYRLLLYEGDEMEFINAFGCFENLKIEPSGSLIQFKGEIAKDLKFSKEELTKIKQNVWRNNMFEIARQMNENKKSSMEKVIDAENEVRQIVDLFDFDEEEDTKYRPAKKYEKLEMKAIQLRLKEMGLELEYEEQEEFLMLSGNFTSLEFSKDELRMLVHLLESLDLFLISPVYESQEDSNVIYLNENEETCKSIRILIGLYLGE